jgi:pilus assembly protein CpaB
VAGIVVVFLGLLFMITVIQRATSPPIAATPIPPKTDLVVVTIHDIPIRTVLGEQHLTLIQVPVELVPLNALTEIDAAVGRISKIPMVAGEMVVAHHLADPTNIRGDLGFVLDDNQVLLAFPATDLMSQIDLIQAGDVVDILASLEQPVFPGQAGAALLPGELEEPEEELFTFNALQRVAVSAVVVEIVPARGAPAAASASTISEPGATPQPTPTPQPSQILAQAILLAVSPQDALVLKHIKDAGGIIDIVLRSPTSTARFELNPVMSEYLRDRYELVISQ